MTTFREESLICGACSHVFTYHVLSSTNVRGSRDLDSRPPEMQRSTMRAWIQRCPSCGYCSRDVTKIDDRFRCVIDGSAYRSQLADTRYPDLASTFICAAMLAEAGSRRDDAAWAYLHAAWTLDDANKDELARLCRSKAADWFLALLTEGHSLVQQPGVSEAIVADCMRRAGRGVEALSLIEAASSRSCDDFTHKVLALQKALIQRGDTGHHLVTEAFETKSTTA